MPFDSQNDRIIVWETKRKLLKSSPPIPTNLKDPDSRKNWLMNQLLLAMGLNSNDLNPAIGLEAIGSVKICLQGVKVEDLESLYTSVSNDIVNRNGYVADCNISIAALMG